MFHVLKYRNYFVPQPQHLGHVAGILCWHICSLHRGKGRILVIDGYPGPEQCLAHRPVRTQEHSLLHSLQLKTKPLPFLFSVLVCVQFKNLKITDT